MASLYSSEILAVISVIATKTGAVSPPTEPIRVALYGGMYPDTVNPTNPDVHYVGRIKSDVVLDKKIGVVFWGEESEIDFGYIDIAIEDQDATLIAFAADVTIATVDLYRVGADNEPELLSSSRSSDIGFVDEDTIRFRLESSLQGGFDASINEFFYDDTYPHLEGTPYPIAWGTPWKPHQLMPTVFVDATTLRYDVTDLDITTTGGADAHPYDRGIALDTPGTAGEFIIVGNGFELQQNPDGKITFGIEDSAWVDDPEDTGNNLAGLFRIVRLGMTRAEVWDNAVESELTALAVDVGGGSLYPFYHTLDVTSLAEFMDFIFNGFGGWYYVDELSNIHFGQLIDPEGETADFVFNDSNVIGEIEVEDDLAPCLSTKISYGMNPGVYDQDELAGGVTAADRVEMTTEERVVRTTQAVTEFYQPANAQKPIHYPTGIFFFGGSDLGRTNALSEVNRWWSDLYPQRRRFYTFSVQLNDALFDNGALPQLGDFCSLQSDTFGLLDTALTLLIRRVRINFATGLVTFEGWG